jgi:hypothetical protein
LRSSTNLSGCRFRGRVYFTAAGTGSGRLVGNFRCRGTVFESHAWFSGTKFTENAEFTKTEFAGKTTFKDAMFLKDATFTDVVASCELDLRRTRFEGQTDLRFASLPEAISLYNTRVRSEKDVRLPEGWRQEELPDGESRIVAKAGS